VGLFIKKRGSFTENFHINKFSFKKKQHDSKKKAPRSKKMPWNVAVVKTWCHVTHCLTSVAPARTQRQLYLFYLLAAVGSVPEERERENKNKKRKGSEGLTSDKDAHLPVPCDIASFVHCRPDRPGV
jgi:hypothetical protein